jgi:hypothetical protein
MMSDSLLYQVEETLRNTASEPHNLLVVIVKFLLWGTSLLGLVLSFKSALASIQKTLTNDNSRSH